MTTELTPPPSYEYTAIGPWFVSHIRLVNGAESPRAWTMWSIDSAVIKFWSFEENEYPFRRTVTDGRGIMILGSDATIGRMKMVGTRETMDATLKMVESNSSFEDVAEILSMVEKVRLVNGNMT